MKTKPRSNSKKTKKESSQLKNSSPVMELPRSLLQSELNFDIVYNDDKLSSLQKLLTLKNLISKQLPKMPPTYITKILFDKRH